MGHPTDAQQSLHVMTPIAESTAEAAKISGKDLDVVHELQGQVKKRLRVCDPFIHTKHPLGWQAQTAFLPFLEGISRLCGTDTLRAASHFNCDLGLSSIHCCQYKTVHMKGKIVHQGKSRAGKKGL